ncbi:DUF4294 domain-containing protein [Flavobacterium aciduliphilum]|uniref:Uncharacterized protein DUF4294 n=1 Tax=Flavobacterium aciduliphilum TaxID=1101402 RepID=A0A328Y8T6_9FLAO|nr:DUF4294 domain-containing protein [Flavobacterium aciduliphilum]RAR69257.1 uncharacterized protein DUF4294 [Flavobacterium aciduliphilum]
MLKRFCFFLFLGILTPSFSQTISSKEIEKRELDSVKMDTIQIEEVVISREKMDPEALKEYKLLQYRVYKVYPYAKIAAERILSLKTSMGNLKTEREKKKYLKIVEDYLNNEFKDRLKKLSQKQGQILVKLIYRQTGIATYDLIKDYKSGWKAFWSNTTARFFNINLKTIYQPYYNNEDFLIETILTRAFVNGRLIEQKAAKPIDIEDLNQHWQQLADDLRHKK